MPKTFVPKPNNISIYRFIKTFVEEKGYSPTLMEIVAGTGIARSSTQLSLNSLIKHGYLRAPNKKWRGLSLTNKSL